jgi:Na+/melibiose symporter-like transporter
MYKELVLDDINNTKSYVFIIILYTASVNIPASLWNYYLIYKIGGDEVWITAKIATTYMVKAIMFHIWPTYIQKYGIRKISIISLIAISPIPLIFMLARSFASQIALEVYSAIWWSSWDLCTGLYNLYILPKEKRASILAVITLTTPLI